MMRWNSPKTVIESATEQRVDYAGRPSHDKSQLVTYARVPSLARM